MRGADSVWSGRSTLNNFDSPVEGVDGWEEEKVRYSGNDWRFYRQTTRANGAVNAMVFYEIWHTQ